MDPNLALAIESCVLQTSPVIIQLFRKINQVRVFKEKCRKLGGEVAVLHQLLDSKRSAVRRLHTLHGFKECIRRVEEFVMSCLTWSIGNITLEVFVRHEYLSLRKELYSLRDVFVFDSVTEILAREGVAFRSLLDGQRSQTEILRDLQQSMRELDMRQRQPLSVANLSRIQPDLSLDDSFTVEFDIQEPYYGRGGLRGIGPIICYPIQPSRTAKENLDVYRNIQEGAYVQRLYGILEANNKYYAVMEEFPGEITLHQACVENRLPATLLERAQLASDLAKSMAWYHKAELLLKSVADHTIVLKRLPSGRLCPFLTNLENVRNIYQKTSNYEYDIRYEAPEYQNWKEHSQATDVWSLGIVIWQCISGAVPYGIQEPVPSGTQQADIIREKLLQGEAPGKIERYGKASGLSDVILNCLKQESMSRTTADAVAKALQGIAASMALPKPEIEGDIEDSGAPGGSGSSRLDRVQEAALRAVKDARDLNKSSLIFVQSTTKIGPRDFVVLLEENDGSNPVLSFTIGASLWWNITEVSFDDVEDDFSTPFLSLTDEGKRVALALKHLEDAAHGGYTQAYLEMYKAHAFLAREFKAHLRPLD